MDWDVFWTAAGAVAGGLSAVCAVCGGVCGIIGLLQARKANELAEEANRTAEEALRCAHAANEIAAKADEISADANAISQRALDVGKDEILYLWDAEFDRDLLVCSLVNKCPYKAEDVMVLAFHDEGDLIGGSGTSLVVPGFGHLDFRAPLLGRYLHEAAVRRAEWEVWNGDAEGPLRVPVRIYVSWTSEGGVRRSHRFEKPFGEFDRIDRIDRRPVDVAGTGEFAFMVVAPVRSDASHRRAPGWVWCRGRLRRRP